MRNILYIGNFKLPDKNAAAHRVLSNAKLFKACGFNIYFSGIIKANEKIESRNINGFIEYPLVEDGSIRKTFEMYFSIKRYIEVIKRERINVVVAYNMKAVQLLKLIIFCRQNRIKLVCDCTEWYDYKLSINPLTIYKWLDVNITMMILNKCVDGLIVISSYLKKYYSHMNNIILLPPLVDLREEKWSADRKNCCDNVTYIYAGNPGDTKDKLKDIIEAYKKANLQKKRHELIIAGLTKLEYERIFKTKLNQMDFDNKSINFLGVIEHKDSIKQFLQNDYLIFIRDKSVKNMAGFPTKFVEGFTAGISVITNETSDIGKYFSKLKASYMIDWMQGKTLVDIFEMIDRDGNQERKEKQLREDFYYMNWVSECDTFFKRLNK